MQTIHCFNYGYGTLSLIGYQTQQGCDVTSLISRPNIGYCRFVITWLDVGSIFSCDAFLLDGYLTTSHPKRLEMDASDDLLNTELNPRQ